MNSHSITIGLFGTCGDSVWRNPFIYKYASLGIPYYNPQKPKGTWKPEFAGIEAEHLAKDKIILFPILGETSGLGSLGKVGFSILNAIQLDNRRNFIILIEPTVDTNLVSSELVTESLRLRELVLQHLNKLNLPNVYIVDTLKEMLDVSLVLYSIEVLKSTISCYSLNSKRFDS